MRIVIAGGTGFLGAPLASLLARDGHDIVVLTRGSQSSRGSRESSVTWTPNGETGSWASVVDGAGAVVNLAAMAVRARARHCFT